MAREPSILLRWLPTGPRALLYSFLVPALLFSVFLRFHNIEERGLDGSDNVYYTNISKAWTEGDFIYQVADETFVYRPVTFLVYAAAIKLFGYHDSSIKKINAFLDSLNVLLIFLICSFLVRDSLLPAFSASILYGFLPTAILMARTELPHVLSGLMVLLAFYTFLLYFTSTSAWRKRFLLILSGILTGLGALTHEELIFLGPGYLIFLFLVFLHRGSHLRHLKPFVTDCALFSASIVMTSHRMLLYNAALAHEQGAVPFEASTLGQVVGYLERVPRLLWNSILANSSSLVLYLFVLLLLILCFRPLLMKLLSRHQANTLLPSLYYLPLVLVLTYFALYSYFFEQYFIRLFVPLFPLIVIFLVVCYSRLLSRLNLVFSHVAVFIAVLTVLSFNLEHYDDPYKEWGFTSTWASAKIPLPFKLGPAYGRFLQQSYSMSWARAKYEQLKAKVNSDAKLLVTSSILYPWAGRRTLQMEYYFGDNAIYLIDHTERLDELISKYRIKYVLFTKYMADKRLLGQRYYTKYQYEGRWKEAEALFLGASYGFKPGEYTLDREYHALTEFLQKRSAKLLYAEGGDLIYQISEAKGQPRLDQTKNQSAPIYSLISSTGESGETIISSNGTSIGVMSGALQGFLDAAVVKSDLVEFIGWAADLKNSKPPEAILVFVDGKFLYSGRTHVDRPDLVKAYGNAALHTAGFNYAFPLQMFNGNPQVRLFAVSKNGVASELNYPRGNQLGGKP